VERKEERKSCGRKRKNKGDLTLKFVRKTRNPLLIKKGL